MSDGSDSRVDGPCEEYELLRDAVSVAFNPPDGEDSEVSLMVKAVEDAAMFISIMPCGCEGDYTCLRCKMLGRRHDRPVPR